MRVDPFRTAWLVGLLLLAGCGSGSAVGPESVCGGTVSSEPQVCDLVLDPASVAPGGTFEPGFGLADLEGDVVAVCVSIAPGASNPFEDCVGIDPIGAMANDFFVVSPGFPAVDTVGADLAPGAYLVSFAVVDALGHRSNVVTAALAVQGTPPPPPPMLGSSNIWYASMPESGSTKVCVTNLDGLPPTCIADLDTVQWRPLAVARDGSIVAHLGRSGDGYNDVFVMNGDGADRRRVAKTFGWDYQVAISPDGTRVAWQNDLQINVVDVDGTGHRRFAMDGRSDSPQFTLDGRRLVFHHQPTQPPGVTIPEGLFIVDLEEGIPRRLTPDTVWAVYPVMAPDGESVLFALYDAGTMRLASIRLDGSGLQVLGTPPHLSVVFDVSPDGSAIAYSTAWGDLYLFDLTTGGSRLLALTGFEDIYYPSFSPDGGRIVFAGTMDFASTEYDIYVVGIDGAGLLKLTEGPARDHLPLWR